MSRSYNTKIYRFYLFLFIVEILTYSRSAGLSQIFECGLDRKFQSKYYFRKMTHKLCIINYACMQFPNAKWRVE